MSLHFSKYALFEKQTVNLDALGGNVKYDRLLSGYNHSDRVCTVFGKVSASVKHWMIFPEYNFDKASYPVGGTGFFSSRLREDEYICEYFEKFPLIASERLCIDTTGFMRPHLMFLMRFLHQRGIQVFDLLYSEPLAYSDGERTAFSSDVVTEVRQVCGFEGEHTPTTTGDFLVVGCGYDNKLMEHVANHKSKAKKIQLFPFPALRPHMYQENRLRTQKSSEAFGHLEGTYFAPAYDPFVTAEVLHAIADKYKNTITNLYLSPLATKPQVVGFALFCLRERQNTPTSIIFPFTEGYSQKTSKGISHIWKYRVDYAI